MSSGIFRIVHVYIDIVLWFTIAAEPRTDPIGLIVMSIEMICIKNSRSSTTDYFGHPVTSHLIAPSLLVHFLFLYRIVLPHVLVVLGILVLASGTTNRLKDDGALGASPRASLAEFARFWRWSS